MPEDYLLIVGASSDIGSEVIRHLATPGLHIFAHYHRSSAKITQLQQELEGDIIPIQADLADEQQINQFIQQIRARVSHPVKILHLAAPKVENMRFHQIPWQAFQTHWMIQFQSIVLILQAFLPLMAKVRRGKVVLMLSSYTLNVPPKALAHYIAVKYALLGLMKALAAEYAEKQVQINAVSPSMVATAFLDNIPEKVIELTAEAHPLKRNATPRDIAPVIAFLLSEEANYITGANIPVCGGGVF